MSISVSKLPTLGFHPTATLATRSPAESIAVATARFAARPTNPSPLCFTASPSHFASTTGYGRRSSSCTTICATATPTPAADPKASSAAGNRDDRVVQIHTVQEFEAALTNAKSKLVVVEYAALHSANSRKIYPAMVDLSRTSQNAVFLLVLGDETEDTKELCIRAGIQKVPHFAFYKNGQIIHEEEGIDAEQLENDVLYYGDPDAPIHQLHGRADFEALLQEHKDDNKLLIIDVGLKNCGPCVKVYPTFIKLSKRMADTGVFARLHGDESDDCMELLKTMGVVEVPTFLFIKNGKLCGRYVGSGRGSLIGEVLRHQGVRVT